MSRRLAQRYEERILPWMETSGTFRLTLSQHIPLQDSRRSTFHPRHPCSGIDIAVGHAVQQASTVYPKFMADIHPRVMRIDLDTQTPCAHYHDRLDTIAIQDELLRHLLRLQGLPRCVGRPRD